MAKDPAINWYFDNWSGGTRLMSRHQKGCYIDLLDAQFHSGPLSLEEIKAVLGSDFQAAWPIISKKFARDNHGSFFNERLEAEKQKRAAYSESRSRNRKKKDMNNISVSHEKHMKNTPEIGIETDTEIKEGGVGEEKLAQYAAIAFAQQKTCKMFSISEINNARSFMAVGHFLLKINEAGKIEYYLKQLDNYFAFKLSTQQQRCNIETWLHGGKHDINEGHWCKVEYNPVEKKKAETKSRFERLNNISL